MKIFKNHTKHITAEQINRYLNGRMSKSEMHSFERKLIDDQFSEEAFEAYQADPDALSDIPFLNQKIDKRIKKSTYPRLAIAAAVAIVLCSSIILFFNLYDEKPDTVSLNETKEEQSIFDLKSDSLLKQKEEIQPGTSQETRIETVVEEESISDDSATSVTDSNDTPSEESFGEEPVEVSDGDEQSNFDMDIEPTENDEVFFEETVIEEDISEDVFGDASGDNIPSAARVLRSESQATKQKASARKTLIPSETFSALGAEQISEVGIQASNAIPVIGIEPYKQYLKDLLPLIRTDCPDQISAEFTVDPDGRLVNFRLLESRSDKCSETMRAIIFDGPKWTLVDKNLPRENNVVNLTITSDIKE